MNQVNFEKLATDLLTEIEELKLQVSELKNQNITRCAVEQMIMKARAEMIIEDVKKTKPHLRSDYDRVMTYYTDAMEDKRYDIIVDGTIRKTGYTSKWKLENAKK